MFVRFTMPFGIDQCGPIRGGFSCLIKEKIIDTFEQETHIPGRRKCYPKESLDLSNTNMETTYPE